MWVWLIPLAAVVLAGWLGYRSWAMRGLVITIQLDQGYGLHTGDDVRYRGIGVGQIRSVELSGDLGGVAVTASLRPEAVRLARAGARIWVVRPQVDITGVAGLETLVGPRYLAILPGDGPRRRHFVALSAPPVVDAIGAGDLEIVLQSPRRAGVRAGAPVLYRQVRVGTILSVGLTSDGGAVDVRVHIQKAYAQLVRAKTRFWTVGGLNARVGLSGVSIDVDSIETLLGGGVALATPPGAGEVVRTGHRFQLVEKPEEAWLTWEPVVAIGSSLLPPGALRPAPMRAVVGWKEGRWIKSQRSRRGWVLQTQRGLLGPADLLRAEGEADRTDVVLEVAGRTLPLASEPTWAANGLAALDVSIIQPPWPRHFCRVASVPEDCVIVGDPAAAPLPLAAARLTLEDKTWLIDPAVPLDEAWHGACVLARSDGSFLGLILVGDGAAKVALMPDW